jgi:hypothetical protein
MHTYGCRIRVPSCTGFFGPYTICFVVGRLHMYHHYFVSCTLDLCSLRNDKQQLVPKNPEFSKKAKKFQKKQNLPKKPELAKKNHNWPKIWLFFGKFGFFLKNLALFANFGFLANFGFFWLHLPPIFIFFQTKVDELTSGVLVREADPLDEDITLSTEGMRRFYGRGCFFGGLIKIYKDWSANLKMVWTMVCPSATSNAGARWPRCGLVVVAKTSCRDNKVQMIRPYIWLCHSKINSFFVAAMLFSGGQNAIYISREYYQEYACDFDLIYYPFDTQVCKITFTFNIMCNI